MCLGCFESEDIAITINNEVKKAAALVSELYELCPFSAGGYAHIVTDDWNLSDNCIDFCIDDAEKGGNEEITEKERQQSLKVLHQFKKLNEDERYIAMALYEEFIDENGARTT